MAADQSCVALALDGYQQCDRCGIAWRTEDAHPECKVMTFKRMHDRVLHEAESLEMSHRAMLKFAREGGRVNPLPMLERAAELRAVLRLLDRVIESEPVREALKASGQKRAAS